MVGVRELRTQSEAFWRDEYRVDEGDIDLITGLILEAGKPQRLETLASAIILHRFRAEKEAVAEQARRGKIYRPADEARVGEELVFPAFDFAVGKVVDVRPGRNPKYGPFQVIRVRFEEPVPGPQEREFASSFVHPHPLNRPLEELVVGGGSEIGEEELIEIAGPYVSAKLQAALEKDDEFVYFDGTWFLRALLPEIHIGHLNLAEAVIYEAGHPVSARDILQELELETTTSIQAQLFALNHALGEDERFDNVSLFAQNLGQDGSVEVLGKTEGPVWYLRALEPEAVFERPAVLRPAFRARGGEYVGITTLDMIDEIGDELDDVPSVLVREVTEIRIELPFPHLYAGTLPATQQFLNMLPVTTASHFAITLAIAGKRQEIEAWVLPEERYIAGLGDWYAAVGMCVGGRLALTPTGDPFRYQLAYEPSGSRRSEWLRAAMVEGGELVLQMARASVEVVCDREMLIDVPDREAIVALMAARERDQVPLSRLIRKAFAELAKLSSGGVVHIKGLYSVVNLMRRSGLVPILAELARNACFDPVGQGYWAYSPALEGTLYQTPDEMRERPLSGRDDLVKDQVVQYLGR
ncbi:MAG: hypothetical protein H5T69_04825 [Chloroflexi bacterium]|nr:hypothetical protein [Chloroflexota bacterium]